MWHFHWPYQQTSTNLIHLKQLIFIRAVTFSQLNWPSTRVPAVPFVTRNQHTCGIDVLLMPEGFLVPGIPFHNHQKLPVLRRDLCSFKLLNLNAEILS